MRFGTEVLPVHHVRHRRWIAKATAGQKEEYVGLGWPHGEGDLPAMGDSSSEPTEWHPLVPGCFRYLHMTVPHLFRGPSGMTGSGGTMPTCGSAAAPARQSADDPAICPPPALTIVLLAGNRLQGMVVSPHIEGNGYQKVLWNEVPPCRLFFFF